MLYRHWEVISIGNMIIYKTYSDHFGWIKNIGSWETDNIYMTYSSQHEEREHIT